MSVVHNRRPHECCFYRNQSNSPQHGAAARRAAQNATGAKGAKGANVKGGEGMKAIPDNPSYGIHKIGYYSCGLPVDEGHFHVTNRGAVKCLERQRRKQAKEKKA